MAALKKINDTTFSADSLGDVKPKVTVGGKDDKKFIPNLNASFFDDEFYFNLNRKNKTAVDVADSLEVAQIPGEDTDDFYIDDEGRLKWDIIFKECPKSLILEWELKHTDGIEFFYQGELTDEEIADGCVRPDDVVGSYAVYCNKTNNKYKTGKLTHIYRPFVIDADGVKEWAVLLIEKGKLTITLPEKFMQSAKYPVRLDPTFGYTTAGATISYQYTSSKPLGSRYNPYTAAGTENITQFSIYAALQDAGNTQINMAAYTISGTNLNARLGTETAIDVTSTTPGWWNSATVSIAMSSASYGLAESLYGESNDVQLYYDTTYDDNYYLRHGTAEALPATWNNDTTTNRILSFYATYEESSGNEVSGSHTLTNLSQSGTLDITQTISGSHTLTNLSQSGTLDITQTISGSHTLTNLSQSGSIDITQTISGSHTLTNLSQAGNIYTTEFFEISGTHTLSPLQQAGAIDLQYDVTGTNAFTGLQQSGTIDVTGNYQISGTHTLGPLQNTGTIDLEYTITGTHAFSDLQQSGTLSISFNTAEISGGHTLENLAMSGTVFNAIFYTYLNIGVYTIEKYLSMGEIDLDTYIDAGEYTAEKYIDMGEYTL